MWHIVGINPLHQMAVEAYCVSRQRSEYFTCICSFNYHSVAKSSSQCYINEEKNSGKRLGEDRFTKTIEGTVHSLRSQPLGHLSISDLSTDVAHSK